LVVTDFGPTAFVGALHQPQRVGGGAANIAQPGPPGVLPLSRVRELRRRVAGASGDINGTAFAATIITGWPARGPGRTPGLQRLAPRRQRRALGRASFFFACNQLFSVGFFVAAVDFNFDGGLRILVGTGASAPLPTCGSSAANLHIPSVRRRRPQRLFQFLAYQRSALRGRPFPPNAPLCSLASLALLRRQTNGNGSRDGAVATGIVASARGISSCRARVRDARPTVPALDVAASFQTALLGAGRHGDRYQFQRSSSRSEV